MLLPTHLLPSALGLEWNLSRQQCLDLLLAKQQYENIAYLSVRLQIAGDLREVDLFFVDSNNPDVTIWYDAQGKRHDWAFGTAWDVKGKLVVDFSKPVRPTYVRELAAG